MATETNIQESVCLKKDEREENAFTSESFEEKVTELPGNKVKQPETSTQVAEIVNTPVETGKPTDESGIFFQALSVPMVIADEHSNTPESCKAAKQTEPEEEEEETVGNEEKAEPEALNMLEKNQGDSDGVTSSQDAAFEDIKETTTEQHVTTVSDFKEQNLNEMPREFVKEETQDKSIDAQEASEQCEIRSKDIEEQKSEENVKKIEQDEQIEEIRPGVVMEEKKEENGLLQAITSDACISTQTKSQVEIAEHQENNEEEEKEKDVNVLEKDQNKDDITSAQEVAFEGGLQEKNDHNGDNDHEAVKAKGSIEDVTDVCVSTQTTPGKESIKDEEPDDEMAIEKEVCEERGPENDEFGGRENADSMAPSQKETLKVIEKDQGASDGITSSQEESCVDVKETTAVQNVTTVVDFKEQDLNEKPRDFIAEETEYKSLDAQETSEECEKGVKEDIEHNPEESVKKTEKEEETEEIKPGVEAEENKEQNELLPAITANVCISTQTNSQVEKTEKEEEDTQNDDGLKEKSDSPPIKEVCEETGSEKADYEKEVKNSEIATVKKDENGDEEKEQQVNVLEKDEGEDDVTSAHGVAFEKDLQEKNNHNEDGESEVAMAEESKEKDTEVIRSDEKTEQQMLTNSIPSDVCVSTNTEPEEEITQKNEEVIESDDGQTNKSRTPVVEEIHEENVSEKTESEEGLKLSDSSSMVLNVNETARKDEDHGKEQEIYVSEEGQSGGNDVTSSENASNKDTKETAIDQHDTTVADFESGQGPSATHREILIEEAEDKSVDAQEETEQHDDGATDQREKKSEGSVNEIAHSHSKNEQEEHTDEIKPSVETNEKKDLCISTQIESQEDATKNEENAVESDSDRNENSDNPFVKEICEENDLKKTESEEEIQLSGSSDIQSRENIDEDTKENKSSDETKENMEQQELLHVITPDVCSSTQTEYKVNTTESEEKINEETIENDDGQTKKPESPLVEVACEATSLEMAASEEGVKHFDSFSTKLNENLEKEDETKTSEVQGGADDVTRSENASNEDIKETTVGQHATTVAYVEDVQGVSATPKEILIEEAEDKSIDAEEISSELGQPNEQNVEETHPSESKTISKNPEDEIKREDKDLPHESVEDTNDNTNKEEKYTLEHDPIEEHNGRDEVSEEKIIDLNERTEVEPQEYISPSSSLETSTKDTSNLEKEKAESENLPIKDLETVSEVQIPELVSKSEDLMLKEESFISETETNLDEEKGIVTKEISSDEKIESQGGRDDVASSQKALSEDMQETTIGQHATTVAYVEDVQGVSATPKEILIEEAEDKSINAEEMSLELGQPSAQNGEETHPYPSKTTSQNPEDEIKKEDKDVSHESVEDTNDDTTKEEKCTLEQEPEEERSARDEESNEKVIDLNETTEVKLQEDITPSTLLETSTEVTSNSEKEKSESENLPIKDLEIVSEVHIPESEPKSEECFISEMATHLDEEKGTTTKEISSDEKTEQTTEIKQDSVKEVCEETSSEKTELEEGLKLSDSSSMKINEKEIAFKDDDQEKDHEVNKSAESLCKDNITSSQDEVCEEKEDLKEKNYDNEGDFIKSGEGVDEDIKEINSSVETKENTEHVITTNVSNSTQIETDEETTENEEKNGEKATEDDEKEILSKEENLEKKQKDVEETKMGEHDKEGDQSAVVQEITLELGQPNEQNGDETHPCLSKIISENPEEEIKKENKDLSHESVEDTNDNTTKEEKCTLEQEPVKEQSGQDEVSKDKVADLNETTEVEPQEDITPSTLLETSTEYTSNSEKEKAESENLPIEDLETVSEVHILELVPKSEESVLKEESFISETNTHLDEEKGTIPKEISSDEKTEQTTEIKKEIVKEECEEIRSEKAEFEEGIKLSNEKGITGFEDEHQEKDQEVSISAESQGDDNITSSKKEACEEKDDLQEKNYHDESNEHDFIKSREGVYEDTEEVKSSVETKENTEDVITTNVCSSTQTPPQEEATETEEKNGEKAIENEYEIVSRDENLEEKQEDVCSSTQPKEETIYNEDTQEKEHELEISEPQGGRDDVISSQNTSNEDIKETAIGQHATTMVHFEEGLGVNAITKEITREEVEDKSTHAQEASEQSENGAKEKIEQPEESVNKPVNSCSETIERSIKEEADAGNKEIESELEAENQADRLEDRSDTKDEAVLTEKVTKELGQPKEQNIEEIQACLTETISEKTEDKITKKDEDLSHDSIEHINENITTEEKCFPHGITKEIEISALEHEPVGEQNDSQDEVSKKKLTALNESTALEPQEDVTPSSSLGTSAEDTSKSDKAKAESENLPTEDLESVIKVHIPEVMPKSEDSKIIEECLISETAAYADEENETVTKEISSDENLQTHGSTQPENLYSTSEENVIQLEQTGETNSLYGNRDMKEDVTQESQLNSIEDCGEKVKDVILTEEIEQVPLEIEKEKGINDFREQIVGEDNYSSELEEKSAQNQKEIVHEISNSNSIPVENPEVTELNVDGQIRQEDLQGTEDISCVSKATNDRVDQEAKEERIPSLEDVTVESQVNLSNIESTAYPSETEKLATRALESDCAVQIPEVVADSEDSKVKEERNVLETAEYTDENNVEKQNSKTNEISSAQDKEQENITKAPTKSDEAKSSDLIIEEKAIIKENPEIHGELEPTSEPVTEKDQVAIETKPQPEQSEITCENITNDQTLESKLEHTSEKDLEAGKGDTEEDVTLAPENEITSIESQNETTRNIILTDEVAMETEKEKKRNEIGQVSEEDTCPKELDNTSTPNQKESADEIEYAKTIPVENTEVTEVKAERQIDVENIQAADTEDSIEDTADPTSKAENLSVKDETFTVVKGPNEDNEIIASEFESLKNTAPEEKIIKDDADNEKVTLDRPQVDDSAKTTYDSITSATEQDVVARSEESRDHGDMIKLEEKPTEGSEITTEVAEIVPECREASAADVKIREQGQLVHCSSQEPSEDNTLLSQNDKNTENLEVLPSVEKDALEGVDKRFEEALVIDAQKHEKDLDHETKAKIVDVVSNEKCSEIEPPHLNTKETTSEFINQENQMEQKKEAEESIEAVIPVEDVKNSTREPEVGSADHEVPSVMYATADKANNKTVEVHEAGKGFLNDDEHLESKSDRSKPIEEGSGMKQEPLEYNAPQTLGTADTVNLKISQKYVTDDLVKSQTHPEIQKHEPAKGTTEMAENFIGETDSAQTKDQQVDKKEIGESEVKTDEEEGDNEDDEKTDAPVMVEASKDIEVKVHKKSHNILSGVGSKVKHSIAKVKKAITGKSSPPKSPSPKAKDQVIG